MQYVRQGHVDRVLLLPGDPRDPILAPGHFAQNAEPRFLHFALPQENVGQNEAPERSTEGDDRTPGAGSLCGKWQAANWPCGIWRSCGSTSVQICWARGQRVRKRQPDGGLEGDGISLATPVGLILIEASGIGTASSRVRLYGWAGRA